MANRFRLILIIPKNAVTDEYVGSLPNISFVVLYFPLENYLRSYRCPSYASECDGDSQTSSSIHSQPLFPQEKDQLALPCPHPNALAPQLYHKSAKGKCRHMFSADLDKEGKYLIQRVKVLGKHGPDKGNR